MAEALRLPAGLIERVAHDDRMPYWSSRSSSRLLLVLVTLVQMLYMDTVRLRARELPFLELFRSGVDERLGLKPDEGILTFSLVKHTMLALLGALFYRVTGSRCWKRA